jgi:hypothetical protein
MQKGPCAGSSLVDAKSFQDSGFAAGGCAILGKINGCMVRYCKGCPAVIQPVVGIYRLKIEPLNRSHMQNDSRMSIRLMCIKLIGTGNAFAKACRTLGRGTSAPGSTPSETTARPRGSSRPSARKGPTPCRSRTRGSEPLVVPIPVDLNCVKKHSALG